jgi:hypothetical protein
MNIRVARAIFVAPVLLAALGGCVYRSKEVERSSPSPVVMAPTPAPAPSTVVVQPPPTVATTTVAPAVPSDRVVYPEGRWQLYGDGRGTPYYWVWIPTGSTLTTAPTPPMRPATSAVVSNSDRTYSFKEGRWQLYGDGGATPYYWVWIPSGYTPPAPPMPPQAG